MKTRILGILGLAFFGGLITLLLIPNVTRDFDTNPASLTKYLGAPIHSSAEVTHLAAMSMTANDGRGRHLQSTIKITRSDFLNLATQLGLTRNDSAVVLLGYLFESNDSGRWWNPPEPLAQLKLPDRYAKHESTPNLEHDLTMIWMDGIAYLYESKFEGPIPR